MFSFELFLDVSGVSREKKKKKKKKKKKEPFLGEKKSGDRNPRKRITGLSRFRLFWEPRFTRSWERQNSLGTTSSTVPSADSS
jgi:hypothetical protein